MVSKARRSSSDRSSIFSRAGPSRYAIRRLAFCSEDKGTVRMRTISSKRLSQTENWIPSPEPEKAGILGREPSGENEAMVGIARMRLSTATKDAFKSERSDELPERISWANCADVERDSSRTSEMASTAASRSSLASRPCTGSVSSNSCRTVDKGIEMVPYLVSEVSERVSSSLVLLCWVATTP
ncbi:unnamed protein product [Nippostrongylus brasiliensis]|uniref:Uncharacterized protein n=1 Tax=Nippostrongylus brasiliensis TaxID=27835 RepID=A0A0N4YYX8_NIPBR|nr:unnamed protein product [Nippostrongylus brasiliensis]